MKRFFLFLFTTIFIALFLSRCIICKKRWSDKKAYRVFNAKNIPLEIKDTVIENRHIHYAVSGNDSLPALIFIHGSAGSWIHFMKYMLDADMRKKFRIINFDRPGFGFSGYGKAMHLQDQCKLLLPVLKSLKKEKPMVLCGHSYGGPVVSKLAADAPTLFEKVIITSGSLDPAQEKKETWRLIMGKKPLSWFLPGAYYPSNTELLYLKKDLVHLANDLSKITAHIVFIHGDKDTRVPVANIAYGLKMMVNAASIKTEILQGAGHQIPWKNMKEFKRILLQQD